MRGIIVISIMGMLLVSCWENTFTPKPRGLYRIDIPKPGYVEFTSDELPYTFFISRLVTVELPLLNESNDWLNLNYESLNAKIYCSYQQIKKEDLPIVTSETRELVERSGNRADKITEHIFENPDMNVYGILFAIDGEVPSPVQFMLTDSLNHFFRGALYYQSSFDIDSILPVTKYLQEDINNLIHTFRWK